MTKQSLRVMMQQRRSALDTPAIERASAVIQSRVMALAQFEAATTVGLYMALPHEVQTQVLSAAVLGRGKTLCVPASRPGDTLGYGMARVAAQTAWRPGPLGVPEPRRADWVDLDAVDVIILPGVAFDPQGGRLGHGGGHIDRLLAGGAGQGLYKIGLAFACQFVDQVPCDAHDVHMDLVISNRE